MSSAQSVLLGYGPLAQLPEVRQPIEAHYRKIDNQRTAWKALSTALAILGCGGSVIGGIVLIVLGAKATPLSVAYIVSGSLLVPVGFIGFAISSVAARGQADYWRYPSRHTYEDSHYGSYKLQLLKQHCGEAQLKETQWKEFLAHMGYGVLIPLIMHITAQGTKKLPEELLDILRQRDDLYAPLGSGFFSTHDTLKEKSYSPKEEMVDNATAHTIKSSPQVCEAFVRHADALSYNTLLKRVSELPQEEWIGYELLLCAVASHPELFIAHRAETLRLPAKFLHILAELAQKAEKDPKPFVDAQARRTEMERLFSPIL